GREDGGAGVARALKQSRVELVARNDQAVIDVAARAVVVADGSLISQVRTEIDALAFDPETIVVRERRRRADAGEDAQAARLDEVAAHLFARKARAFEHRDADALLRQDPAHHRSRRPPADDDDVEALRGRSAHGVTGGTA